MHRAASAAVAATFVAALIGCTGLLGGSDGVDPEVQDALDAIISQGGYHYRLHDTVLRVFGSDQQTRIFTLDYVMGKRQATTTVLASSGGSTSSEDESVVMPWRRKFSDSG